MADDAVRRIELYMPAELHRRLKVRAAEEERTMRAVLLDAIERYLAD